MDHQRLLVRVATMWYEEHATQGEIAATMGISRQKVQRLLQEALDSRIVQIRILAPLEADSQAERALEELYGLREVIAVEASTADPTAEIGRAAAGYLASVVRNGSTIALSWGSTLLAMVNALEPSQFRDVRVVQVLGALREGSDSDPSTGMARRMALALNAALHVVPAPGVVRNAMVHDALVADPNVAASLELGRHADLAFVGIGSLRPRPRLLQEGAFLETADFEELERKGAVGDIALRFFDEHGRAVTSDLDRRVVGLGLSDLRALELVAVGGGPDKRRAIRAALRAGLVNVLITDAHTARALTAPVD
jgi:DNA-binding transcriptional regulator LsrR (DeoR family)